MGSFSPWLQNWTAWKAWPGWRSTKQSRKGVRGTGWPCLRQLPTGAACGCVFRSGPTEGPSSRGRRETSKPGNSVPVTSLMLSEYSSEPTRLSVRNFALKENDSHASYSCPLEWSPRAGWYTWWGRVCKKTAHVYF